VITEENCRLMTLLIFGKAISWKEFVEMRDSSISRDITKILSEEKQNSILHKVTAV
jgi:hypothetical protein